VVVRADRTALEARSLHRHRALAVRLSVRTVFLGVIVAALSTVPLIQPASARLSQKGILVEPNDALPGLQKVVDLQVGAEMVGFTWMGGTTAAIDVRGLVAGGWTEWLSLDGAPDEGPDHQSPERRGQVFAGPAWLGHNIETIEFRVVSGVAHYLSVHAVDTESAPPQRLGVQPAGADTPLPFITSRKQWGADESLRTSGPDYAERVDYAVVHHTVNSNSYGPNDSPALVRGIYLFHTQVNGWSDIGYNFLIDRFGRVFEGRYGGINQAVIGGHAGGFNGRSTGVSLIGDFTSTSVPAATYQSLRQLLDWKLAYHHINPLGTVERTVSASDCNCQNWPPGTTVTIPTISGHRDLDQTGCPGQFMYDLISQLRNDVAMDIGSQGPAEWTCQWDTPLDYGPGATSPSTGRDDVFARGDDGQLWQKVHTSATTTSWIPHGGYLTSDPDVTSSGSVVMVVARGGDNALWVDWWNGIVWSGWSTLGGYLASAPSVVSWGPSRADVFACGRDGAVWTRSLTGATWSPWTTLFGMAYSAPDATSDGAGRLDVFVRGVNGAMWHRAYRDGAWGGWFSVGGVMASGAGAASWGPNRFDLVTRGADGALWASAGSGDTWFGWYSLGGVLTSDPDITAPSFGHLVITGRGTDRNYWQQTWDGQNWSGWRLVV
jgi:hypothetical protein